MKIAVITGRGFETFGGVETYVKEVYEHLGKKGHKIIVYSRRNKKSLEYEHKYDIEYCILPYLQVHYLDTFAHCILSVFASWFQKVDIICYHGSPAALVSCLPVKPNIKKLVIFHGLDRLNPILNGLLKLCIRVSEIVAAKCSHRLIVISPYLHQYFLTTYGVDSIYIPPGVSNYALRPPQEILKWNLTKGSYILYLGRLTPEKGCHLLIQAYLSLVTKMKLVIAGPTPFGFEDAYYRYLKIISKNDSRIIFTGLAKSGLKEELLSNAYFVVYPSLVGGLSLTILEAMGYKRCTLVSSVCDYYPVVKSCSVLFKKGDKEDLAKKLNLLIQDPIKCIECGESAQDYVFTKFSWQDTASMFEKVFSEVKNNGHSKTSNRQRN